MNLIITGFNCFAQAMGFALTIFFMGITINKNFIEFTKLFLIILITDLITFGNFEYLTLPLIVIVLTIYFYIKNKNVIVNTIIIIICIMVEFILLISISSLILIIFSRDFEYFRATLSYNLFCGFSYIGIVLILRKLLRNYGSKIKNSQLYQKSNSLIPNLLIINLITILLCICLIPLINNTQNDKAFEIVYTSLVFIFIISSISSIFIFNNFVKVETEKAEKNKELELTVGFQKSIKKMYEDIMNFKHDYIKIYSTFKIFIENNDMIALEEYFSQNITPLQDQLHLQQFNVKSLINIKDIALQGIIYTAILKAENFGISVSIDIQESISNINMQIIDLCRIIGIFLDNAIEESEKTTNSYLNICFFNKNKCTVIIIENSCSKNINITDISNNSTKGKDRGRGLNIVKSIIKNYSNIVNNTYINEGKFVQELWIEKEDSE